MRRGPSARLGNRVSSPLSPEPAAARRGEAGLQAPARLPGTAAGVAAHFEPPRRGGQREPPCSALPGGCVVFCCVFRFCASPWPLCRWAVAWGGPASQVRRRQVPKAAAGPGGQMPNPLACPPAAFLQSRGPCDDRDGSRSRRRREGPEHTRPPPALPLHPCAPPQEGPPLTGRGQGLVPTLKAPAPHPPAPASATAQTPAVLRFGGGVDASPCGLAPQGTGCRVQPRSPAPSSLRLVREHQGFWGAQRLQACRRTGEPRGPDALAAFHWVGASLSRSPAEQQDGAEAVCRGEARARGDAPRDTRLGRRLAEQSLPGPLL